MLHKEHIENSEFRTEVDWIRFREQMSEDDLFWFEQQAYEFAGRLLVPVERLRLELDHNKDKIKSFVDVYGRNQDDLLFRAVSRIICSTFGVSEHVIFRRIRNEKILSEFDF